MTPSPSIAGQAGIIGVAASGGAVVGFILSQLVAYYFGIGSTTDAFFMAASTSELLTKFLMGGSVTAVFLPMFVSYLAQGKRQRAWFLAMNLIHIFTAIFAAVLILAGIFAEPFISLIAPGFDETTQHLTVRIFRVLLPSFLFLFLVDIIVAILHSLQHFTIPALLRLIAPAISVVSVLTLHHSLGIYALAVGTLIGSAIQLILVMTGVLRYGFRYRWVWAPRHPDFGQITHLLYPFIFSMLVTQGAGITYRILVSVLSPGSLSALKYAEKITQLLTIIFITSITTVIYPRLAAHVQQHQPHRVTQTLSYAMRLTLLLTVPLMIGAMMLSTPIIQFVYERGSFSPQAVALTSTALFFLSINLCTTAVSSILGQAVLAMQRTRAAVAITIASQAVAISLFVVLVPRLQLAGLALASSLVPISAALLSFIHLRPLLPHANQIFWQLPLLKIAVLGVVLMGTLRTWQLFLTSLPAVGTSPVIQLVSSTIVGSSIFFGGAWLWRMPEMDDLRTLTINRLKKLRP